jgi:hypothetical protein
MILYMRTRRFGLRRAAFTGAVLFVLGGAWWLLEEASSPEASKETAAPMTAPAGRQVLAPAPDPELPVLRPAAALPSLLGSVPLASPVTAMPSERDDAAAPLSVVPAPPQSPSTAQRDPEEPD